MKKFSAKRIKKPFSYNSKDNPDYLDIKKLKKVISEQKQITDYL